MFRANDINGNSIFIDDANKNNKYFCPACDEPLVLKRGTRKKHHFAHYPNTICKDNWHYEPMSEWHLSWQNWFDKENREVWIKGENESHRADVSISNCIIEFQHSRISNADFNKRNKFYTGCNKNVIWIFDMKNQITLNEDGTFYWEKKNLFENTFADFINYNNKVTVYFEIENNVLIPILDFDNKRYFKFRTFNDDITHLNFLKDFGIEQSPKIKSFKELINNDIENCRKMYMTTYSNRTNAPRRSVTQPYPQEWAFFKKDMARQKSKTTHKNYSYKKRR